MSLEPPIRPYRCKEVDCDYPLGGHCAQLHGNPDNDCERLVRVRIAPREKVDHAESSPTEVEEATKTEAEDDFDAEPAPTTDDTTPPWSGQHVEYGQLEHLTFRSLPRLIAVLGPHDAGKTSLLASFFLQIANGQYETLPYRFASSRTLLAFDHLVLRANEWSGHTGSQIVEHTSKDAGTQFLHLGLRPVGRTSHEPLEPRHVDVLFSDIAGERTTSWSQKATGAAASTMAFVQHSDSILFVADAARLLALDGRTYDGEIASLIRRVASVIRNAKHEPRISLVFTKIDRTDSYAEGPRSTIPFDPLPWAPLLRAGAIRTAINALTRQGRAVNAFAASAFPRPMAAGQPLGVVAPFSDAIAWADRTCIGKRVPLLRAGSVRPFSLYAALSKDWE